MLFLTVKVATLFLKLLRSERCTVVNHKIMFRLNVQGFHNENISRLGNARVRSDRHTVLLLWYRNDH